MNDPKFKIGETVYWVEASAHYGKKVPCSICFGKLFVTIILGNGEKQRSQCGYCSHGLDGPSGMGKTWEPQAHIRSNQITGISNKNGWTYEVGFNSLHSGELFKTEEEAEPIKKERLKEVQAQAKRWFEDDFVSANKKQMWSTGYHRDEIKRHNRSIVWHELRLGIIKENPNGN